MTWVTLRGVPWNAPFYARAGFAVLDPAGCTPGLHAVLARDRSLEFPMHLRVVMQRWLGTRG
ncbi:hypothetical protein [Stenotrophomonas sp. Marseille-Q4652]|uniref:hypothetical protein n=1 Tax=Stenotrophomonas sp. Marseille-Q4652 TaxID=2866595 RepID=UPI001CE3F5A8|nr:hypothetical protein [Stenotrophomonas sp. Marseille-Q4652]